MDRKQLTLREVEDSLKFTPEEKAQIQLEMDIIQATIEARKNNKISQRDLAKKTGLKQPVIARIESRTRSPRIATLLKILYPMGYTLKVVPISKNKK